MKFNHVESESWRGVGGRAKSLNKQCYWNFSILYNTASISEGFHSCWTLEQVI